MIRPVVAALLAGLLLLPAARADSQRVSGLQFQRVVVNGDVEVEIRQGETTELKLRGSREDLERQPFFVDDGTLVLGRNSRNQQFENVRYKVTAVDLEVVQLKGSGDVYVRPLATGDLYASVEGSGDMKMFGLDGADVTLHLSGAGDLQLATLKADTARFVLSGSGEINVGELRTEDLEATLKGSGDIRVKGPGEARRVEINLVGSGDTDLEEIVASRVEANIVGSGNALVHAVDHLEANILGSGDVYYRGEPEIESSVLGSGHVGQSR